MDEWSTAIAITYAAGVLLGIGFIDATPATRVALALVWPLGPVAFVVTIVVLLLASLIAFPLFGVACLVAAGLGLVWWLAA